MKGLTPIILILVSVGIFIFFIDPQKQELNSLLAQKKLNDETMVKARQLREGMGNLKDKYNKITNEEKAKLNQILPSGVDNIRLVRDINNIAKDPKYGITLRNISVSGDVLDRNTNNNQSGSARGGSNISGTINVSFSFSTNYETFKAFLKDLEDSLRLVDVVDFSVTGSEQSNLYNYSVTLKTYWLKI